MKKNRLGLVSLLAALVLSASVAAAGSLRVEKVVNPVNAPGLDYTCVYPRIQGIGNGEMQQLINVRLREKAICAVQSAQIAAKSVPVSGSFGYEIKRNDSGIFSMAISDTLKTGNGTRVTREGVTVNTVDGSSYRLKSLFRDHADYVGAISEKVKDSIYRQGLDKSEIRKFSIIGQDADFYLTDDSLVILVAQKTVFKEECGVMEFSIPLKSLDGLLRPQFLPLA